MPKDGGEVGAKLVQPIPLQRDGKPMKQVFFSFYNVLTIMDRYMPPSSLLVPMMRGMSACGPSLPAIVRRGWAGTTAEEPGEDSTEGTKPYGAVLIPTRTLSEPSFSESLLAAKISARLFSCKYLF